MLALSKGDTIAVDASTFGGYTFELHSTNATTINKINSQAWDFVVLQEQSQRPSFPPGQVMTEVYPFAALLDSMIEANNPCTETVFFMTWGRKYGDQNNCPFYPPLCTYAGMQQRLFDSYMEMGDTHAATVAPVGIAFKNSMAADSTINLYTPDNSHPSMHGTYLAACVFYATLLQKSPVGATYPPNISATDAAFLQNIAAGTVLDSMEVWNINENAVMADFGHSSSGNIHTFTSMAQNETQHQWDFGDGNTSTQADPTHTYDPCLSGDVTVTYIASSACGSDTATMQLSLMGASTIVADFSHTVAGMDHAFTSMAQNAATHQWDFGDGNTSAQANPIHTYDPCFSGDVTVTYIVSSSCGSDTATMQLSLFGILPVVANFNHMLNGINHAFMSMAQNATSHQWDFGDGNTSAQANPIHTYDPCLSGDVTVTYIASSACGSDTATMQLNLVAPPPILANFVYDVSNDTVTFSSSTLDATSHYWDFGDGTTSTNANPIHAYGTCVSGEFIVTYIATTDCSADTTLEALFIAEPPMATASFMHVVMGDTVNFTSMAAHATSHYWDFGDGNTSTDENPQHIYENTGQYTITYIVTDVCGADTLTETIELSALSIEEELGLTSFTLYPNPSKGMVHIEWSSTQGTNPLYMEVLDLGGHILQRFINNSGEQTFDLRNFPKGLYLLRVEYKGKAQTLKLLLE